MDISSIFFFFLIIPPKPCSLCLPLIGSSIIIDNLMPWRFSTTVVEEKEASWFEFLGKRFLGSCSVLAKVLRFCWVRTIEMKTWERSGLY